MMIKKKLLLLCLGISSMASQAYAIDRYDAIAPLVGCATTLVREYRVKKGYVLFPKTPRVQSALGLMWFIVGIAPAIIKDKSTMPPINLPNNIRDATGTFDEDALGKAIKKYKDELSEHRLRVVVQHALTYSIGAYTGANIAKRINKHFKE